MARVTFTYECGEVISKFVAPNAPRSYGDNYNGQAPIRIVINGRVSPEYFHIYAMRILNPNNRSLRYKGKEVSFG